VQFDQMGSLVTNGNEGLQRWPIMPDPETGELRIGPPQSLGLSARAPLLSRDDVNLALGADGRTVAQSPQRGQVIVFDTEHPHRKLFVESPGLQHAALSPDGRWLATGHLERRRVKIWDAQTGKLARDLDLGGGEMPAWPAFSPDGKWLVTGTFLEY